MRRTKRGHRLNWVRDLPDHRDWSYHAPRLEIPKRVDLRPLCSPVVDQGQIGSCTGNALAGCFEFLEIKENADPHYGPEEFLNNHFDPVSRLFIYWNERVLDGTTDQDAGAQIRDGVKTLNQIGACREKRWGYSKANLFRKPGKMAFAESRGHQISEYRRIGRLDDMKSCLAEGFPFVFGFTVFESFESDEVAKTGLMPMPKRGESVLGGHAVMAVGYEEPTQRVIIRNSWGTGWGDQGYFYMPYSFIGNARYADDMWTIRK